MATKPASASLHPGPGFRIRESFPRPEQKLCGAFQAFQTPEISDQLNRLYTLSHEIQNRINNERIAGPAVTVKLFPGDNLMLHKAIDVVEPGDVVMVDAGGTTNNAVLGDLIASKLKHRQAAGVVVDGLIRDLDPLKEVGLPVFAKGVSPIGPLHRGPGELNFSVCCGGIVVNPGDIVVADNNGIVVIRQDFATELLARLQSSKQQMAEYESDVKRGEFSNRWVDKTLQELTCLSD